MENLIILNSLKKPDNLEISFKTHEVWEKDNIYSSIANNFIDALTLKLKDKLLNNINLSDNWKIDNNSNSWKIHIKITHEDWKNNIEFGIYENSIDEDEKENYLYFYIQPEFSDKKTFINKIYNFLPKGNKNETYWWDNVKSPFKIWHNDIEAMKKFAFPKQYPNVINYFSDKLIILAQAINKTTNES